MTSRVVDAPIIQAFGEQLTVPANTGNPTLFGVRERFKEVMIECAAASRIELCPRIQQCFFYDNSQASGSQWINLLDQNRALTNRDFTGGTGTTLDSWATADYLYIGCKRPFGGVAIDLTASVNGNPSVLTAEYSKNDDTFASTTITDGTDLAGDTLGQDGDVTIDSVPTDWDDFILSDILSDTFAPKHKLYWLRLDVSAVLDADVEIQEILAFDEVITQGATSNGGLWAKASTEYVIDISTLVGAIGLISQGGATTANVSWLKH
ncbi:MAG: hypothetical protein GWN86_06925 [Desulfobacterales bacterium]|nr:hypothetical protein [Desulfobacterales bacterium]